MTKMTNECYKQGMEKKKKIELTRETKTSSFLLGGEGGKYENKTGAEYFSLGAFLC